MKKILLLLITLNILSSFCKAQTCNNWLYTPSVSSTVSVGDLDVPGNQITVEATINRTQSYLPGGGDDTEGDVVSKHNDFSDVNYILRPNHAYITTTNGFFGTPDICDLELNKTYHVALVYDGNTLKFYRDGFLMSQVNATGNLYQNNWKTRFGHYEPAFWKTQFIGYINEVRIWNVARTQAEIKTYMNASLASPTTQTGLVAYYTFDNLLNKQGNGAYDGVLTGSASINATNTSCAFIADSCNTILTTDSVIINTYTPVISLDPCENKMTVEDASTFNTGDTVLLIQMQGAVIDSTNTSSFGTITDYKNAGNYEFNYVKSKTGNVVELLNNITRPYDIPFGKVQLIRVPYYNTASLSPTLTCLLWDGAKGGVLVLNARDSVNLNADIDVTGRGFSGGKSPNTFSTTLYCFQNNYTYPMGSVEAAAKGEGLALINNNISWGKGASANAGGSGLGHNSGGGGGSNGGAGGFGGYQLEACGSAPFDNRGIGGRSLLYSNMQNKIFMGGGGGAGHTDNVGGSSMYGGNGGGVVIINAKVLKSNGFKIFAKGADAPQCTSPAYSNCHDGSGGGGGGGTILINNNSYTTAAELNVAGGKGADLDIFNPSTGAGRIGPGGGGGAGITWINNSVLPPVLTTVLSGGINGVIPTDNNNPWGTTQGQPGINLFNLKIPFDTTLFISIGIPLVKASNDTSVCIGKSVPLTVTGAASYSWSPATGLSDSSISNPIAKVLINTQYIVTGTNTFGCFDTDTVLISITPLPVIVKTKDSIICQNLGAQLWATGGVTYQWSPVSSLSNPSIANPLASPTINTIYHVTVTGNNSCIATDSVKISIRPAAVFTVSPPDTTCFNTAVQLLATGGDVYTWSPAASVTNANIANPKSIGNADAALTVFIKENACNTSATLSTSLTVLPIPVINVSKSNDVDCSINASQLTADGAATYLWSPATGLNNSEIANPVSTPLVTTQYSVTGTDAVTNCTATGFVTVVVNKSGAAKFYIPSAFSPNNDGINDCFKVASFSYLKSVEISIYNRFGNMVFHTTNVNDCWDGSYKGNPASVGNYVYYIKTENDCESFVKKGNLILVR